MPSLADLIRMGKQYIGDAMPGGSLNPETAPVARQANYLSGILDPASQVSQDATNWHKRTQIGLKDQLAGRQTPEAEQAYQTMMMAAGMAPIGMTAWHGSPHKFDKFSLDKIGTGEGAQAYGHGAYLAESQDVAKEYAKKLSGDNTWQLHDKDGNLFDAFDNLKNPNVRATLQKTNGDVQATIARAQEVIQKIPNTQGAEYAAKDIEVLKSLSSGLNRPVGQLYKTDIPDEAVARFLDWDKPLSQQAPEVNDALQLIERNKLKEIVKQKINSRAELIAKGGDTSRIDRQIEVMVEEINLKDIPFGGTGESYYKSLRNRLGDQNDASSYLKQQGISGIRYLDGGSRSAGQGSSNFVAFDPEMIRILERNGQATGLEPWKPGEYRLKDLIGKE